MGSFRETFAEVGTVYLAATLLAVGVFVALSLPDLARYVRIRRM